MGIELFQDIHTFSITLNVKERLHRGDIKSKDIFIKCGLKI